MKQLGVIKFSAAVLFIVLVLVGVFISYNRPIWNDERYSLVSSTFHTRYDQILAGKIEEGNNSPLFYLLQKAQAHLFNFQLKESWGILEWDGIDGYAQVFLRMQSILCTALGLTVLFYFFATSYSVGFGVYALGVGLTAFMLWFHWGEARPYSLWLCLSIIQMVLLIHYFKTTVKESTLNGLIVVHLLLALTATLSMIQILAAYMMIWLAGHRTIRNAIFSMMIPLSICGFYYFSAPKYKFFFQDGPLALINANIPKDRLLIIGVACCMAGIEYIRQKKFVFHEAAKMFAFALFMFLGFGVVLLKMHYDAVPQHSFQISARYFLPLTALGIVLVSLSSIYAMKSVKSRAAKALVLLCLIGLLGYRVYKVYEFNPFYAMSSFNKKGQ